MIWQNVFYNNIAAYISVINEELKDEFPLEPLSNHIKVLGGYAFKAAEYRDAGIPVIRISDFQDERIDLSAVRYFREDKSFDRFQLFSGDIIIAMTGGTIGKLAIVQDGLGKLYLNQRVGKFQVLNKGEFEPEYVYWLARGIQDKVKNLGYGGAQPNVSNGQIEALEFAFPDKKVQLKIIEFLNDLRSNELKVKTYFNASVEHRILQFQNLGVNVFTVLEECNQQQTYLRLLRQTILQEAVQGKLTKQDATDEPATELLKRIKAEKQKLIKAGKLKKEKELPPITEDEIPFELPEGWVWCRLAEVAELCLGKMLDKNKNQGNFQKYLGNINVRWNEFDLSDLKEMRFVESEEERFSIRKGDVVICEGGEPGRAAIWKNETPIKFQKALHRVRVNMSLLLSDYLYIAIRGDALAGELPKYFTGVGIQHFTGKALAKYLIPLPPLAQQHRIVAKVQQLQQQLSQLAAQVQRSLEYAQQLLQSVLREAFEEKGKVYEMGEGFMNMVAED